MLSIFISFCVLFILFSEWALINGSSFIIHLSYTLVYSLVYVNRFYWAVTHLFCFCHHYLYNVFIFFCMPLSELISQKFKCNWISHRFYTSTRLCSITPSSGDTLSLPVCASFFLSLKHEAIRAELREKQEDMDQLISTVEDLQRELEKIPKSDANSIQREMELLRDQWLEVGDTS